MAIHPNEQRNQMQEFKEIVVFGTLAGLSMLALNSITSSWQGHSITFDSSIRSYAFAKTVASVFAFALCKALKSQAGMNPQAQENPAIYAFGIVGSLAAAYTFSKLVIYPDISIAESCGLALLSITLGSLAVGITAPALVRLKIIPPQNPQN